MPENSDLFSKFAGLMVSTAIRSWMPTLEYKCTYHHSAPATDPVKPDFQGRKIFVFWHEYILFPLYIRGNCNLTMLLSQHRDADVLTHIASQLGFNYVRGSTFRGGSSALRELLRAGKTSNLTLTPDGPRGPRRHFEQGAIYLASRLQIPLVPVGFGYDRPWRLRSWDRFAIPRLGSRARAVFGPEIYVPKKIDRYQLEAYRGTMQQMLNTLTTQAENWAQSHKRLLAEQPLRKEPAYWPPFAEPEPTCCLPETIAFSPPNALNTKLGKFAA